MQVPLQHRPVEFVLQCMQNLSSLNLVRHIRKLIQELKRDVLVVQMVNHQFPTMVARVRARVRSCGICGGQSGTGAGFFRVLQFPLPILILPTAPDSSPINQGWYNRLVSGQRTKWTQSHSTSREKEKERYFNLALYFPRNLIVKPADLCNQHTHSHSCRITASLLCEYKYYVSIVCLLLKSSVGMEILNEKVSEMYKK
jgi:hypothetical protein